MDVAGTDEVDDIFDELQDRLAHDLGMQTVNGHMHPPTLRATLERSVAEQDVRADRQNETLNVA